MAHGGGTALKGTMAMATDMDIEMDLDIGFTEEDFMVPETGIIPDAEIVRFRAAF